MECGLCVYNCPMCVDTRKYARAGLPVTDAACILCGSCVAHCPRGTLRLVVPEEREAEHGVNVRQTAGWRTSHALRSGRGRDWRRHHCVHDGRRPATTDGSGTRESSLHLTHAERQGLREWRLRRLRTIHSDHRSEYQSVLLQTFPLRRTVRCPVDEPRADRRSPVTSGRMPTLFEEASISDRSGGES